MTARLEGLRIDDLRRLAIAMEGPTVEYVTVEVSEAVQRRLLQMGLWPPIIVDGTEERITAIDVKSGKLVVYEDLDQLVAVLAQIGRPVRVTPSSSWLVNYLREKAPTLTDLAVLVQAQPVQPQEPHAGATAI